MSPENEIKDAELAHTIELAFEKARAQGKEAELAQGIQDAFQRAYEEGADALLINLKQSAPTMLAEHAALRADFEVRLRERWGTALDLYETNLVIAQEAGDHFHAQHEERAARDVDLVFWVLVRLHARACQTASEILALLSGGYATAAMSRWRAMHEVAVVMSLIRQHGQPLARRYLHHEAIEAAKAVEEYQTYHARLGYEPYGPTDIAQIVARRDAVLKQYGPDFGGTYGWAEPAIGVRKPRFDQLERAAKLDHMRPYYRMASHGIHGNPKGILFQLGQIGPERFLLAGASDAGLADPGHAALIALLQCTVSFLASKPDEFVTMTLQAMSRLVDEAGEAFLKAHQAQVKKVQEEHDASEQDGLQTT
jgi:uncharacterized protein DUF5677